jgi:hypothetical protein
MPARTLFGMGAIGDIVREIQQALIANGSKLKGADGVYGEHTLNAVKQYQGRNSLPVTGTVDEATWERLMKRAVPAVGERCMQLTGNFEGHGFELAVGNFDGALLTWGIIGFTLASGEVQAIIEEVNRSHPELVQRAFGESAPELLKLVSSPRNVQKQWADEHTLKNGALAEPWKSMFASFGSLPQVQAEQMRRVQRDYLDPAIKTAGKLPLRSELGLALCFDIHVQNGGIKPAVMSALLPQFQKVTAEPERRKLVANAVSDSARAAWRDDVRRRKLTIATGEGAVHGHKYVLSNWGLSGDFPATELIPAEEPAARKKQQQVKRKSN